MIEQRGGVLAELAGGIGQAMDETDREIAETNPLRFHCAGIQRFSRWLPAA